MAKDKERSINPAQQQRKADKAKALKKAKNEQQQRRNEKLARRNPDRIQRQIEDLKALEASGEIKPREKATLEDLERDLRAVRKAREALGDKAPQYGGGNRPPQRQNDGQGHSVLGKRQHNGDRVPPFRRRDSPGSDTDESVRRIPMPEDTPPPIPREHRRYFNQNQNQNQQGQSQNNGNASQQASPAQVAQTTYSAAPQLRDLKKEATSRFVPDVVRRKQDAVRGHGGLIEPEEMDRLEAQGYYTASKKPGGDPPGATADGDPEAADLDNAEARRLAEEEARFQRELALAESEEHGAAAEGAGAGGDEAAGGIAAPAATQEPPASRSRRVQIEEVEDEDA